MDNKLLTVMSKSNTLDQMMECGGGVGHYLIV